MSQVLSNTTVPINDFTYDLNSDGKACGNRPTPSVSVDSNVMYVADSVTDAPLLSNTTPSIDDFGLENLNSDGELCGGPRPNVPPAPPPPACVPPANPTQVFSQTIDGSTTSPRSGNFNKLIIVPMVAGQSVSVWYRTPTFHSQIYVLDPTNVVVDQDDGTGVTLASEVANSGMVFTALATGNYTFDCTTFAGGVKGDFTLALYEGPLNFNNTTVDNEDIWQALFVPSTNRLFLFTFDNGADPSIPYYVLNASTFALVLKGFLDPSYTFVLPNSFFNANDNSVWLQATQNPGMGAQSPFIRLDPYTGVILETIPVFQSVLNYNRFIYVPSRNQLYGNGDFILGEVSKMKVYDCGTRTVVATINLGFSGDLTGLASDDVGGKVVLGFDDHDMSSINTTTHAVSVFSPGNRMGGNFSTLGMVVDGRNLYGLGFSGGEFNVTGINLDSQSVMFSSPGFFTNEQATFLTMYPCTDTPQVIVTTTDDIGNFQHNLARFDPSGNLIEARMLLNTASNDNHTAALWFTDRTRTFVALDDVGATAIMTSS